MEIQPWIIWASGILTHSSNICSLLIRLLFVWGEVHMPQGAGEGQRTTCRKKSFSSVYYEGSYSKLKFLGWMAYTFIHGAILPALEHMFLKVKEQGLARQLSAEEWFLLLQRTRNWVPIACVRQITAFPPASGESVTL